MRTWPVAAIIVAASTSVLLSGSAAPNGTVQELRLQDLTLGQARRFNVPAPFSGTVPQGVGFVLTDASSFSDVYVVINGYVRAHLPAYGVVRTFDPPIIALAGDTLSITGFGSATLGGFVVAANDLAPAAPNPPVPMSVDDLGLSRAQHYFIPNAATGWAITNPVQGGPLVLVSWFGGPASFSVDGIAVAAVGSQTAGARDYRFAAPIVVLPGQTLAISSTIAGDGELGGYVAYTGEL
jgi:hypothetical protein